jgi:lipopolysaccharide transport system permease protein
MQTYPTLDADRPACAVGTADQPRSAAASHRKVIEPPRGWQAINLRELWRYRELLYFLIWRDVKVRYKQTVLGAAWAIIQPVMTMVVFSIFFGKFGGMDQHAAGVNYSVFVYAALLPWTFLSTAVSQAGVSLISSAQLVSKVYFPRLLIPWASVGSGLVDFAISFGVMLGLMLLYRVDLTATLLLVPLFTLGTLLVATGVSTLLSALVISYRDFRYVLGFLVQLWMFASPVAYPLHIVPARWQLVYSLNPMVGMISGFRSALLHEAFRWDCIGISALAMVVVLIISLFYFRRMERRFADVI